MYETFCPGIRAALFSQRVAKELALKRNVSSDAGEKSNPHGKNFLIAKADVAGGGKEKGGLSFIGRCSAEYGKICLTIKTHIFILNALF